MLLKYALIGVLVLLSACTVNKGTTINYTQLLASQSKCSADLASIAAQPLVAKQDVAMVIGENQQCVELDSGRSFVAVLASTTPITKIRVRAFYGTTGESAKMFYPNVLVVDPRTQRIVPALVDEIVDLEDNRNGRYLQISFSLIQPLNKFAIVTDGNNLSATHKLVERSTSVAAINGVYIPFDFNHDYRIMYNAGGPIEVYVE
jgi:hypothetical protein